MAQILIIEDDLKIGKMMERIVLGLGHTVDTEATLAGGVQACETGGPDVVLLDLTLPDGNGLSIIPALRSGRSEPEIIIVTGTGDQSGAEVAFKSGAWDFVPKPFLPEDITLSVTRALQYRAERISSRQPRLLSRESIIGDTPEINACLELVARASVTDADVLITGETGTGKELFAQAIHKNSPRQDRPFVVVDCAAYPRDLMESALFGHEKGAFTGAERRRTGLVSQADQGTLFLDEVGELTLSMQKIFLRLLQERTFRPIGASAELSSNFRLVAATNRDLDEMVAQGRFRLDLLHRLRSITISLPPLNRHPGDIDLLVAHHLGKQGRQTGQASKGVSPEFLETLKRHPWPGNIRELFNTLNFALANAGSTPTLHPVNLPPGIRISSLEGLSHPEDPETGAAVPGFSPDQELPRLKEFRASALEAAEQAYLTELMRRTRGRIKAARTIAGLSESRIHALLKKYNTPRFR